MLLQMITTAKRAIKELESKTFSIFFVNSKTVSFSFIFSSFEVCSMCFGCTVVQLALSKVCRGTSLSIRHLVAAPCHNLHLAPNITFHINLAPSTTTLSQPAPYSFNHHLAPILFDQGCIHLVVVPCSFNHHLVTTTTLLIQPYILVTTIKRQWQCDIGKDIKASYTWWQHLATNITLLPFSSKSRSVHFEM